MFVLRGAAVCGGVRAVGDSTFIFFRYHKYVGFFKYMPEVCKIHIVGIRWVCRR